MASAARRMAGADRWSRLRRFDWALLASVLVLFGFGLLSLYSLDVRENGGYLRKQVLMAVIGLVPFAVFYFVNPSWWRKAAWVLYALNVTILTLVLFMGSSQNGAQRWIDLKFMQFQPSELAKLFTILTLASFLAARQPSIGKLSTLALSFLHVSIPAFLIAKQPHYGGAAVLIVIWLSLCVAGNVPLKYVATSVVVLVIGTVVATQVPGALHGYHIKRLEAMGKEDRQGANYQQDRAEVAFGVGGVGGDGLFHGRQSLPEQQNDFIFTIFGEELGLVGCTIALAAFGFFFYRIWLVMLDAKDVYLRMLAAGVLGLLAFHTILNLGMVLHLLPVVGLWLPFMSSGGTALWLCMACVGLLLSIRNRQKPLLF